MSIKDYEGGIITKNPTTPTGPYQDGAASGVWTMDQAAEYTKQGVWPTAGNISPEQYVDGLFSTYLYEGNGTSQTITNNLDLDGKGGLVWIKSRPDTYGHRLIDTARGVLKVLESYDTTAEATQAGSLTAFNSNGFDVGNAGHTNFSGNDFVSWSFLKKPGFFDVVTYTGDGTSSRDIAHNLGSKPGFILTKRLNLSGNWTGYHQSLGYTKRIYLDLTNAASTNAATWVQEPTATHFTVGSENTSGSTYVAYLFAHDDQSFGDNSNESIIKCGSYTGGTDGTTFVDLGFEPQWLLLKRVDSGSNWAMLDIMRGLSAAQGTPPHRLEANSSGAENTVGLNGAYVSSTGFYPWGNSGGDWNANGASYIYIAIRRPMMTPTAATEVFELGENRTSIGNQTIGTIGPIDMCMSTQVPTPYANYHWAFTNRLVGGSKFLASAYTQAEATAYQEYDTNTGVINGSWFTSGGLWYNFKRATGFFDMVAYTGDGTSSRDITHNLGAVPEFIVTKRRDVGGSWAVYHPDLGITSTSGIRFNSADGSGYNQLTRYPSTPTSSVYTVGSDSDVNSSSNTFVSYLFATLAGVSKVGSYTGTAANLDVDCGFTAGARLVMIKRYGTSTTGDWYVWDSVRGIVSGNDPYLLLNSTATEVTGTDYIDPLSSGFTVTSSAPAGLNASGGTYIFLAIA